MPRSRSTAIQSERTRRRSPRALTSPASWIAPPNSSSFSVRVVLPASGCEMIAKVRRRGISSVRVLINQLDLLLVIGYRRQRGRLASATILTFSLQVSETTRRINLNGDLRATTTNGRAQARVPWRDCL